MRRSGGLLAGALHTGSNAGARTTQHTSRSTFRKQASGEAMAEKNVKGNLAHTNH